jgi:ribonuclease P protein component
MIWADNSTGHPRLGLLVPKAGANAVARNRLRRRIKEVWRREILPVQPDWDLLVRARRETYAASFQDLRHDMLAWRDQVLPGR